MAKYPKDDNLVVLFVKAFWKLLGVTILAAFFILLYTIPAYLLNGWVITKLWGWFVVPNFGLAPLSLSVAIGLDIVISFFTAQYIPSPKTEKGEWSITTDTLVWVFLRPFLVLLVGYIVFQFSS